MDLDGDGIPDILSGSYSRMETKMAGLFQVLYGNKDGTFRKAEVLKGTDNEPLIIPIKGEEQMTENICTRPFAIDWDGDGHLDLVVGNFSGTFYWFKGEGKGKFNPKPEPIKTGNEILRIAGHHSDPFVVDWDGDGSLDLLSGSTDGGVQWARNRAPKGQPPDLEPFKTLIEPGRSIEYGQPLAEEDIKVKKICNELKTYLEPILAKVKAKRGGREKRLEGKLEHFKKGGTRSDGPGAK